MPLLFVLVLFIVLLSLSDFTTLSIARCHLELKIQQLIQFAEKSINLNVYEQRLMLARRRGLDDGATRLEDYTDHTDRFFFWKNSRFFKKKSRFLENSRFLKKNPDFWGNSRLLDFFGFVKSFWIFGKKIGFLEKFWIFGKI